MFIQFIQATCTRPDELRAALARWESELAPSAEGWLGSTYGFTDEQLFVAVVRFDSPEAATRNSHRPEQSHWWAETELLFDEPVEFRDSHQVVTMLDGGSDRAGFVQIVQGHVNEPDRLQTWAEQVADLLREARPDIIGSTVAVEADGTFIETVAFSDETAARAGERRQLPTELQKLLDDGTVEETGYIDLHHPWFASAATQRHPG